MKNDRLFQMLYLLLEKERISAPELAKSLEVSVRTVYRDVETLSMAGVPIFASAGKGGGISLLSGYSFDKTLLSDDEQNQLLFAVQSLQAADQQVDALLQKLGASFKKSKADWITVDFSRWGLQSIDNQRFELIKNAILGKQSIHITYCGTSGEITSRRVNPLRLVYKNKSWYVQAYCLYADDFRLFKIGRILELELTKETFEEDYSSELPSIEPQPMPSSTKLLRLQFSSSVAYRVYDEFTRECVTAQPDGSLVVEVDFPVDSWLISYIFSFGTDVKVLEPVYIKNMLTDYAEKILKHYKT